MTTQDIQCVLILSETMNFSRAAKEMNITQPAFSRMIARVEAELGFSIFLRNTRLVKLSPEGAVFVDYLRQSAAMFQTGLNMVKSSRQRGSGLRIAFGLEFIWYGLAAAAAEYRRAHPGLGVECLPVASELIPEQLRSRQADVGFLFTDVERFSSDLSSRILKRIPLSVVVNRENPLATRSVIQAADLEHEAVTILAANTGAYEIGTYGAPLLSLNRKYGTRIKESRISKNIQESMLLAASNQAVTLAASALGFLVPDNCRLIPIEGVEFSMAALWSRTSENLRQIRAFLNYVQSRCESGTP